MTEIGARQAEEHAILCDMRYARQGKAGQGRESEKAGVSVGSLFAFAFAFAFLLFFL